jgi:hypothetical protein
VTVVVIIKTISFSLLHYMFRLLPIIGRDRNNTSAEINFYLTNNDKGKADVSSGDWIPTPSPLLETYTHKFINLHTLTLKMEAAFISETSATRPKPQC